MNIMMVGHSTAGKTSFMAGLYRHVGESESGYGISSKSDLQKMRLTDYVVSLARGRYPSGTDSQINYEFSFTVDGKDLVPFNWTDYRGGILMSEDPDSDDMDRFLDAVSAADALVVFLDGQKLAQKGSQWNLEYDILISCIERSLSVEHESWFPISFVITKCDLVPDGARFYGLDRFDPLFSQIRKSDKVGGMIVHCSITQYEYYRPFLVLAYSVYGGTPIYINRTYQAIRNARYKAEAHRPDGFLGTIFGIGEFLLSELFKNVDMGWESEYEKTWAAEADVEKLTKKLEDLKSSAEGLKEKLIKWAKDGFITIM